MDAMTILMPILIVALIAFVVVLALMVLKLTKTLQAANDTIAKLDPTLKNVETITGDIQPTIRKLEPTVDRVQLTLDAVNLELMRVDGILEDVAQIAGSASSATAAVDKISNAPVKAVSGVANKVRERFGTKSASTESAQIADKRAAVAQALEEYKAAEEKQEAAVEAPEPAVPEHAATPNPATAESQDDEKPYSVIDPDVIENSPFFQGQADGE